MRTKQEIVSNWLPRYTGVEAADFKKHLLLTNFDNYLDLFCQLTGAAIVAKDKAMKVAVAEDMAMINFGMGSPNAATLMDLLSAVNPEAVLFLGKCGGLKKKNQLGDLVLPIAAIRGEGTSTDYFPPELPALPSFMIHRAVSHVIRDMELDYWSGTVYTTNRRVWEHDEAFKDVLFLSYTVDPEHDTPAVLKAYAHEHHADTARWKFLTGKAEDIYRLGNTGYLVSALEDTLDPERFVHSPNFVLVDKDRQIRGFYDGTTPTGVKDLVSDLKLLIGEERKRKKREHSE